MSKRFRAPYDRVRGKLDPSPINNGTSTTTTEKYGQSSTVSTSSQAVVIPSTPGLIFRDRVTPGFKQMSAAGKIIISPCFREFNDYLIEPFSGTSYFSSTQYSSTPTVGSFLSDENVWDSWLVFGPSYPFPALPKISTDFIVAQASNEAIAASHQRDVLGIVDIAEMGKTVELITENMKRLIRILNKQPLIREKAIKRHKKESVLHYRGRSTLGILSDSSRLWLEVQYGWLPLMMSIEGLMKVLSDQSKPNRQTYRGSASVSDNISDSKVIDVKSPFDASKTVGTTTYTTAFEYNYYTRAGLITDFRPPTLGSLGMELRDLPVAMYELIPFSFVLDWVYDVNTALEAATPVRGWRSLGSWLTLVKEEYIQYIYTRSGWTDSKSYTSPTRTRTATGLPLSTTVSLVRRTRSRTPGISARMPQLDLDFRSYIHAISALALTISIGKKKLGARI